MSELFLRLTKEGATTRFLSESETNETLYDVSVSSGISFINYNKKRLQVLNRGLNLVAITNNKVILHRTYVDFDKSDLAAINSFLGFTADVIIIASTVDLTSGVISLLHENGARNLFVSSGVKYIASYYKDNGITHEKYTYPSAELSFTGKVDTYLMYDDVLTSNTIPLREHTEIDMSFELDKSYLTSIIDTKSINMPRIEISELGRITLLYTSEIDSTLKLEYTDVKNVVTLYRNSYYKELLSDIDIPIDRNYQVDLSFELDNSSITLEMSSMANDLPRVLYTDQIHIKNNTYKDSMIKITHKNNVSNFRINLINFLNSSIGINGFISHEFIEQGSDILSIQDVGTQTEGTWYTDKVDGVWTQESNEQGLIKNWFVFNPNIDLRYKKIRSKLFKEEEL